MKYLLKKFVHSFVIAALIVVTSGVWRISNFQTSTLKLERDGEAVPKMDPPLAVALNVEEGSSDSYLLKLFIANTTDEPLRDVTVELVVDEDLKKFSSFSGTKKASISVKDDLMYIQDLEFEPLETLAIGWQAHGKKGVLKESFSIRGLAVLHDAMSNMPVSVVFPFHEIPLHGSAEASPQLLAATATAKVFPNTLPVFPAEANAYSVIEFPVSSKIRIPKSTERTIQASLLERLPLTAFNGGGSDALQQDERHVKKGDSIEYKVVFQNTDIRPQKNVVLRAAIPEGTILLPEMVRIAPSNKELMVIIEKNDKEILMLVPHMPAWMWVDLVYGVRVEKESGQIEQQSRLLINNMIPIGFDALIHEVTAEKIELGPFTEISINEYTACFSKAFIVQMIEEAETKELLEAKRMLVDLFPFAQEAIATALAHPDSEDVQYDLVTRLISLPCVPAKSEHVQSPEPAPVQSQALLPQPRAFSGSVETSFPNSGTGSVVTNKRAPEQALPDDNMEQTSPTKEETLP